MPDLSQTITTRLAAMTLTMVFAAALPAAACAADQLDDHAISLAVTDRLLDDPAVSKLLIDVDVERGVVSLSGSVTSLMEKERATRLAETVKGVRAIVDRIKVIPMFRPDDELAAQLRRAYDDHPVTTRGEIEIRVERQRAMLGGTVDSWAERRVAERIARGVAGIEAVDNHIEVQPDRHRPDTELEQEINAVLGWDALVDDDQIAVEVDEGSVVLTGYVGSLAERRRASELAFVPGVRAVDSSALRVTGWARDPRLRKRKYARLDQSESTVAEAVRTALARDPRVPDDRVSVALSGGRVTLTGRVDSLLARRAAGETAYNTLGVYRVVNRILVRPGDPDDDVLKRRVSDAIARHPQLQAAQIAVHVSLGVVALEGRVDSRFAKALADAAAAGVNGVISVDNRLRVAHRRGRLHYSPYVDRDWYRYDLDWFEQPNRPMMTGKNDWAILEDVRDELFWSPFVNEDEIEVTVDSGRVTLSGTVDSWAERKAAEGNAYQGGAVIVENDLRVRYGPDYYAPGE